MTKKANRPPPSPPRKAARSRDRGRRKSHTVANLMYLFMAAILVLAAGVGFTEIVLNKDSGNTAEAAQLPQYAKAPASTREAYVYAMESQDVLSYVPCYCGCGGHSGHQSNWNCFIKRQNADGTFVFDDHGATWQMCVDIARDAKSMVNQGKTLREVRAYVEAKYGEQGPGTDTPLPPP